MPPICPRSLGLLVSIAFVCGAACADEGMWLFNHPPLERLKKDYGTQLPDGTLSTEWLLHLQQSSVRFNSGGSGSFVSAEGLVLTNHHVGADSLQKLGDASHNYYRDGFAAATLEDELRCSDLELNVLLSIEDVTARVGAAVAPDLSPEDAFAARRAVMASIEKESLAATGLRSDVVTLYQGARYHLYRLKKYTDVRLVFAPEQQIAFFGGDADNFEFPRYNLDVCFFRVYENGQPAAVPHHLAWSERSVVEGELVFVSGHPGHTDRASTLRELVAMRDRQIPFTLGVLNRLEVLYKSFSEEGPEEARQAMSDLFGVQNGRKNREGILAGLLDPNTMARKAQADQRLRQILAAQATAEGGPPRATPFEKIEQAEDAIARVALRYNLLEGAVGFNSQYFGNARTVLRIADEASKPSVERLREYRDSNRESLEQQLFSNKPIYNAFEMVKLADSLTFLAVSLGYEDPLVKRVLAGLSPRARAAQCVRGTTLGTRASVAGQTPGPDGRQALVAGGIRAVNASDDSMLGLAKIIDEESRSLRKVVETAGEIKRQSHAEIQRAQWASEGESVYPDATFTLRLAFGTVKGYEQDGQRIPAITTFGGLFERARAKRDTPPFDLPKRWLDQRTTLEQDKRFLRTPLNFASTADIIGGNSGSPVVNRDGQLVGLIFDGNLQSLVLNIAYDDTQARAVSVDAAGIVAALRTVYASQAGAHRVASEITPQPSESTSTTAVLGVAAAQQAGSEPAPHAAGWEPLFDGITLGGWKPTVFGGDGEVAVEEGAIQIARGSDLTGITWSKPFPRQHYEIALEAQRVDGTDFFCGLTFPVGEDPCSLIVGGWGGGVVGLSSVDGLDAANNDTTVFRGFQKGRWYAITVRVTPDRIQCFIDNEKLVDQSLNDRRISIRDELIPSKPLGIATYATTARIQKLRWRKLDVPADELLRQ